MSTEALSATPERLKVKLNLPEKLGFLLDLHRYKVVYGGRGASKSWSFADALLLLASQERPVFAFFAPVRYRKASRNRCIVS